jgi:putative ubiquitin-RnfH superfamily antitoxin RatB of RatAB toxin-antitoxin module
MSNNSNAKLLIELIYALPHEQDILTIEVAKETNVEQAIRQSDILQRYPEIDLAINKIGIFSKVCKLTDLLHDGDRIEIYRPLIIDPKEARKARALKQK